jgi:hypothetical protein
MAGSPLDHSCFEPTSRDSEKADSHEGDDDSQDQLLPILDAFGS